VYPLVFKFCICLFSSISDKQVIFIKLSILSKRSLVNFVTLVIRLCPTVYADKALFVESNTWRRSDFSCSTSGPVARSKVQANPEHIKDFTLLLRLGESVMSAIRALISRCRLCTKYKACLRSAKIAVIVISVISISVIVAIFAAFSVVYSS